MTIASVTELSTKIENLIGDVWDLLETNERTEALKNALDELGWSLPLNNPKKEYWVKERSKRHCFDVLRSESARKFRYKQINLSHKFEHYDKMIESMDQAFLKALDEDPVLVNIDSDTLFTYIGPGFYYNSTGQDITYR